MSNIIKNPQLKCITTILKFIVVIIGIWLPYNMEAARDLSFLKHTIYSVGPEDQSRELLALLFGGNVGGVSLGGSENIGTIAKIFEYMNWVVISLGSIVVSYITFISTINTSQDGEIMGKKWSSIWIPAKSIFGMLLMAPASSSGYSIIQTMIMWLIMNGVGAANVFWENIIVQDINNGYSIYNSNFITKAIESKGTNFEDITELKNLIHDILSAQITMHSYNKHYNELLSTNEKESMSKKNNIFSNHSKHLLNNKYRNKYTSSLREQKITDDSHIHFGIGIGRINNTKSNINSKQFAISRFSLEKSNNPQHDDIKVSAFERLYEKLDDIAQLITQDSIKNYNNYDEQIPEELSNQIGLHYLIAIESYLHEMMKIIKQDTIKKRIQGEGKIEPNLGWISTGSNYFALTQKEHAELSEYKIPKLQIKSWNITNINHNGNIDFKNRDSNPYISNYLDHTVQSSSINIEELLKKSINVLNEKYKFDIYVAIDLLNKKTMTTFIDEINMRLSDDKNYNYDLKKTVDDISENIHNNDGDLRTIIQDIGEKFEYLFRLYGNDNPENNNIDASENKVIRIMREGFLNHSELDPILVLKDMGRILMSVSEKHLHTIIDKEKELVGKNQSISNQDNISMITYGYLIGVCSIMWSAGASLAIYLPFVPFIVFTSAALSWLLLVLEAIIAAPLVALALTLPGQDEMGKVANAISIITNIFLRPSIIVISFIFSIRLVKVAMTLVNWTMVVPLQTIINSSGIFNEDITADGSSMIILVSFLLYCCFCISIIHKCFSITYLIPDRILRWIGGSAEQSIMDDLSQRTQQSFSQNTEQGVRQLQGLNDSARSIAIAKARPELPNNNRSLDVN